MNSVKECLLGFVQKLQKRYPFAFATAYRNLKSEVNKQLQERLTTYFLFGAISELSGLEPAIRDRVWMLGRLLSKQVGKGGENFRPRPFHPPEKTLAEEIGGKNFELLIQKAEHLSVAMKFKMGPVNSAEHAISWCFRYVGLLLKAAKWESIRGRGHAETLGAQAGVGAAPNPSGLNQAEGEPNDDGPAESPEE